MTVEHKPQGLDSFQQWRASQSIDLDRRTKRITDTLSNRPSDQAYYTNLCVIGQRSIKRDLFDSKLTAQQIEKAIAAAAANRLQEGKSKPPLEENAHKETGNKITIDQGFVWREAHAKDMGKRIGKEFNEMRTKQAETIRFYAWNELVNKFSYTSEEAYKIVGIVHTENTLERSNIMKSRLNGVLYEANQALKPSPTPRAAKSK